MHSTLPLNLLAWAKGQRRTHIAYGPEPHQRLTVYSPRRLRSPAPVVIFFYGGGWSSGSKKHYRFVAEPFVSAGYICVIPDYAKYPERRYPAFMDDAALAVRWVYQEIGARSGNPTELILAGHSSGAHIATLLATNRKFLSFQQVPHGAISACIGLAGPDDFIPKEPRYVEVFAPAGGNASSAMPASYVDGTQPPMLLLYGLADNLVHRSNLESMREKIGRHGGYLETKLYPKLGHVGIIAAFGLPLRTRAPVVADILEFLEKVRSADFRMAGAAKS